MGSARWVGLRLRNHNFWFLWCQHGWLSGVSTVGWGETQKSQFLVPVVSAWMVEWGQHGGLGCNSQIKTFLLLGGQHGVVGKNVTMRRCHPYRLFSHDPSQVTMTLIRESHRSFPCSTAFLLLPFACWAVRCDEDTVILRPS